MLCALATSFEPLAATRSRSFLGLCISFIEAVDGEFLPTLDKTEDAMGDAMVFRMWVLQGRNCTTVASAARIVWPMGA